MNGAAFGSSRVPERRETPPRRIDKDVSPGPHNGARARVGPSGEAATLLMARETTLDAPVSGGTCPAAGRFSLACRARKRVSPRAVSDALCFRLAAVSRPGTRRLALAAAHLYLLSVAVTQVGYESGLPAVLWRELTQNSTVVVWQKRPPRRMGVNKGSGGRESGGRGKKAHPAVYAGRPRMIIVGARSVPDGRKCRAQRSVVTNVECRSDCAETERRLPFRRSRERSALNGGEGDGECAERK